MNLHLETLDNQMLFRPGDTIAGIAGWELDSLPRSAEVCLLWHTSGKGNRDVGVVDRAMLMPTGPTDALPWRLRVPAGPYSFSGRLITLAWSIELVIEPGPHVHRLDITVSPTGEELALGSADHQVKKAFFRVG